MLKLYSVRFTFRDFIRPLQIILVSERNKAKAVMRARTFAQTHYTERLTLDDATEICRTPDDVLDWS